MRRVRELLVVAVIYGLSLWMWLGRKLPGSTLVVLMEFREIVWPRERRHRVGLGLGGTLMLVLIALMGPGQDTSFLESWWFKLLWYGPYTAWLVALLLSLTRADKQPGSREEEKV